MGVIVSFFVAIGIGLLSYIFTLFNEDIANIVVVIVFIIGICITIADTSRKDAKIKLEKSNKDYDENIKRYKEKLQEQSKLITRNQSKEKILSRQLNILKKKEIETNNRLKRIYEKNIIYPKYQYYIAVCSLLEYFESGRFSTLPDAYNTYEIEVRLDKIITRLDIIIDKLDMIKNNQFQLYNELTKANQLIEKLIISADNLAENVDDFQTKMLSHQQNINTSLENIYGESQILRYCNEQTLKELEFMNRMNIEERDYMRIKNKNKFHFN